MTNASSTIHEGHARSCLHYAAATTAKDVTARRGDDPHAPWASRTRHPRYAFRLRRWPPWRTPITEWS